MTSTIKVHQRTSYREMPWKNGGGSTLELLIGPPEANLAQGEFLWRVSMASIHASGPFSAFPGYDRHIMALAGGGVRLHHPDGRTKALQPFVPYAFPGEEAVTCTVDSEALDFNVMTRRSHSEASVSCHHLSAGEALTLVVDSGRLLLFCWGGPAEMEWNGTVASLQDHDMADVSTQGTEALTIKALAPMRAIPIILMARG